MQIEDVLSAYAASPEVEFKFANTIVRSLKGTVRQDPGTIFVGLSIAILMLITAVSVMIHMVGLMAMMAVIGNMIGAALIAWYILSWKLEFDGEQGWFTYHSLLRGTHRFHISEITRTYTDSVRFRRSLITTKDILYICTNDIKIAVVLRSYLGLFNRSPRPGTYEGGAADADKLQRYLSLYERYILPSIRLMDSAAGEESGMDGLTDAVREAIREQELLKEGLPMQEFAPEEGDEIPELGEQEHAVEPEAHPTEAAMADVSEPAVPEETTWLPPL